MDTKRYYANIAFGGKKERERRDWQDPRRFHPSEIRGIIQMNKVPFPRIQPILFRLLDSAFQSNRVLFWNDCAIDYRLYSFRSRVCRDRVYHLLRVSIITLLWRHRYQTFASTTTIPFPESNSNISVSLSFSFHPRSFGVLHSWVEVATARKPCRW